MTAAQIHRNAYSGSVGSPMNTQPSTNATDQQDSPTARRTVRRRAAVEAVGSVRVVDTGVSVPVPARGPGHRRRVVPRGRPDSHHPGGTLWGMERSATPFSPGMTAQVELQVTDADTAQAMGSGDVPVLGTPRVLALAEAATVAATTPRLPAGSTTVGTRVELEHTAPVPVGATVAATATLAKVDGRRLLFEVTVSAGGQRIAEGRVERVLVDRQRFLAKAFGDTEGE